MKKYKKAFLAGTFDNFHVGHQWLLWQAKKSADFLVVIVARDETVLRIKKNPPKNLEDARKQRIIEELLPDTEVRLGRTDADFFETLRGESPDVLFLGYDQKFDEKKCQELFPDIEVVRLSKYFPDIFKSSKFI